MHVSSTVPPIAEFTWETPGRWVVSVKDWILLTCSILIAALVRYDFLKATNFVIDADEAIVGLMAKHIIEGHGIPVFYYGQHYMGSLEAILVALFFWVAGISAWSLQFVPLLCSVALAPVIFFLTRELGGRAAAHFATLLYALPPAGLLVWSSKARGGFIEILLIGAFSLLYTCRWIREKKPSLSGPALIGFLLGVGWWVNNQILYFMAPIAIFMFLKGVGDSLGRSSHSEKIVAFGLYLRLCFIGASSFILGSSPYWIYNVQLGFPSLGMFGFARASDVAEHIEGLFTVALPILLGSRRFWDASSSLGILSIFYLLVYALIGLTYVIFRRRALLSLLLGKIDTDRPIEILPVFILVSLSVFVVSTFGWLVQAPRYLLPVYVGLFPLCAVVLEKVGVHRRGFALSAVGFLIGMNTIPAYFPSRALQGEPVVFKGERVEKDHAPLIKKLNELNITKVRANYWIGYRLAFETSEKITFVVFQEPRTVRMPQYEVGISCSDKDTLPLVVVPAEAVIIRIALRKLGYSFKEERVGGYHLFYALSRDESRLEEISPKFLTVQSNVGTLPAANSIDGALSSRWGTGGHQKPGQQLIFTLAQPSKVDGVQLETGEWMHDYPRGLSVRGVLEDGSEKELVSPKDYSAVRYFAAENGEVRMMFEPTFVKQVVLEQMGKHPVFDWSVAEVVLFKDRGENQHPEASR